MSFQSLDFLLQQSEENQSKKITKKSCKINLHTPFGLNDLIFDDNEIYSCDQNISSSMSLLHLQNQMTDECSNITDYISKHLSLLSNEESKLPVVDNVENIELKFPLLNKNNDSCTIDKCKNENTHKLFINKQGGNTKKYKLFRTKPLAKVKKSPLEQSDSGLSLTMGRKYPKSSSNLMNNYLCNILIKTRSQGFKFNTPSPDESVLSWMDIVRQMPNK